MNNNFREILDQFVVNQSSKTSQTIKSDYTMIVMKKYNFENISHIFSEEVLSRTPPRQFSTPGTDKEFYQGELLCCRGVLFNCAKNSFC